MLRPGSRAAARLVESAPVFAALGDRTRLRLVLRLCTDGPQSITSLGAGAEVSRQAITKHLQALAAAGLVCDTRSGRERIWQIEPQRLAEARRCLEQISQQWDEALSRLKALVEE